MATKLKKPEQSKGIILIVDDDPMPAQYYIRAIDSISDGAYLVTQKFGPATALEFVKQQKTEIKLIILDEMMPSESYPEDATEEGRRTGNVLYRDIREILPSVPVIIITHVDIDSDFRAKLPSNDRRLFMKHKLGITPSDLAEFVMKLVASP